LREKKKGFAAEKNQFATNLFEPQVHIFPYQKLTNCFHHLNSETYGYQLEKSPKYKAAHQWQHNKRRATV
jgi:hypothetical protein